MNTAPTAAQRHKAAFPMHPLHWQRDRWEEFAALARQLGGVDDEIDTASGAQSPRMRRVYRFPDGSVRFQG